MKYRVELYWDEENDCVIGECPRLGIVLHAGTMEHCLDKLLRASNAMISVYEQQGLPLPGGLNRKAIRDLRYRGGDD